MDPKQKALIDKIEAKIDQTKAEMDRLKAKAKEAHADSRVELHNEIDSLERKKRDAEARMKELKSASGNAWEDVKGGAEQAWEALSDSVRKATERFS